MSLKLRNLQTGLSLSVGANNMSWFVSAMFVTVVTVMWHEQPWKGARDTCLTAGVALLIPAGK